MKMKLNKLKGIACRLGDSPPPFKTGLATLQPYILVGTCMVLSNECHCHTMTQFTTQGFETPV